MRAAVITAPGESPICAEFAEPIVDGGRVMLDVVAAGIHPIVRSLASGTHYGSEDSWPQGIGVDAVARTAEGTLVYTGWPSDPYGTIAERVSVPRGFVVELPSGADASAIAGGLNPGLSSWMPLLARANEPGGLGTVLVLGATGVSGRLAVQNALALGAGRIVAVGRDQARLADVSSLGAHATVALSGDGEADASAIASALDGESPRIVIDYLWGDPAESVFRALGRRGLGEDDGDIRYVQIGASAGENAAVPAQLLRSRRFSIVGSGAGSSSMADVMAQLPVYIDLIAKGAVSVPLREFSLEDVETAWADSDSAARAVILP